MGGKKRGLAALVALVATFAMALGLAAPAWAAGSYTVTIANSEPNHTYTAYQIFSGDVATVNGAKRLSNVKWASGINPQTLISTLKADDTTVGESNIKGIFDSVSYDASNPNASAQAIAAILGTHSNDSIVAQRFAAAAKVAESTAAATSSREGDNYKITLSDAGYYLFTDALAEGAEGSVQPYILEVLNATETVATKTSTPSLVKKVQENETNNDEKNVTGEYGTGYNDTADYAIGDTVPFKLIGSIPDGIDNYSIYKYVFTDTLSESLTFTSGSVKVYLSDSPAATMVDVTNQFNVTTNGQTITIAPNNTNQDLKLITGDGDVAITDYQYVIVTFDAKLNGNAALGRGTVGSTGEGNVNKAHLTYSNNPSVTTDTADTPDDEVIVFSYQLNLVKVDGADTAQKLSGAEFRISRVKDSETQYAIVDSSTHMITNWTTTETASGTILTTGADGTITIGGLDDGEYTITEIKAPEAYNLAASSWTIDIVANTTNGQSSAPMGTTLLQTLTATLSGNSAIGSDVTQGTNNGYVVSALLRNSSGYDLPITGGADTIALTVAGVALVAGAAIVLSIRKRANDEQ